MVKRWTLQERLSRLSAVHYELAIAVILYEQGWDVVHTGYGSDGGYDLEIAGSGRNGIVEVKKVSSTVPPKEIRAVTGAAIENDVSELAVISHRGFSREAPRTAHRIREHNSIDAVGLIKGTEVVEAGSRINGIMQLLDSIEEGEFDDYFRSIDQARLSNFFELAGATISRGERRDTLARELQETTSFLL